MAIKNTPELKESSGKQMRKYMWEYYFYFGLQKVKPFKNS